MTLRHETVADVEAIREVTIAAFKDHPISNQTEHHIVDALRRAGALTVSLVAEIDGRVVGHIAFSPVTMSDGSREWYGLGPVSVIPILQRQGVGSALIREGLASLRRLGASGCALVGDPDYYGRFGFENYPQLIHDGVPQEVFLLLPFGTEVPSGRVQFHPAFLATE